MTTKSLPFILFPFLSWFKNYSGDSLRHDLIAGITVALVLIPQSMAYAQLAGLPPHYGLYASFLPPMVAALFGSSRRLATGPVAVVSMMTAAALEPLAVPGSEAYIAYAVLLSFCVGLFQFLLGILRLGVVVNLLSHPVVTGFINAAALIIASSQLSKLFGIHVDKAEHYYETMQRVYNAALHFTHWPSFFMGLLAFVIMIGCKKQKPGLPCVLFAVALTTTISWLTGFENNRYVSVREIEIAGLVETIDELNSNLDHILQTVSATALLGGNKPSFLKKNEKDRVSTICSACHRNTDVQLEELKKEGSRPGIVTTPPEKVLELHLLAGVLDRYLAEEKKRATLIRKKLRSLHLVSVRKTDGSLVYHLQGDVPRSERAEKNIWRIHIGNETLVPEKILLVGGGEVVGGVPRGLPRMGMPRFDLTVMGRLLLPAIVISILGFMEAISIAKDMAAKSGYRLDPSRELMGQGLGNIAGSFSGAYPTSGSFSRSAVNFQAGARTGLSSVFTSLTVIVALLFCTPLLYHLPQSVLAAIIITAVIGLVNVNDIRHAFIVNRADGVISLITFGTTLFFAPHLDRGILVGVLLSAAVFFYRKMRPTIAELSLWEDGHYRNTRLFDLRQCRYIAVIRFDGPLFYGNISYLEEEVLKIVRSLPELKIIHFKCNGINEIDTSGEHALTLLVERLQAAGYQVCFSGLKVVIVEMMRRSGLLEKIGEDHIFPTLAAAMEVIWPRVHEDSEEATCPLKSVLPRKHRLPESRPGKIQ